MSLLKGEYDDQLQWLFNANITVQLLNWSGDNGHEEKTIPHHKAPLEGHTRITVGDRAPGGWGYGQFISHSVLESISSDTRYINKDSVCFKIVNVKIILINFNFKLINFYNLCFSFLIFFIYHFFIKCFHANFCIVFIRLL